MPSLPFAPRPLAGEALSSWAARLAVHNFVTPADVWADLGSEDAAELALHDDLLERLSARTRLSLAELRRTFAPDGRSAGGQSAWRDPRRGLSGVRSRRRGEGRRSLRVGGQRQRMAHQLS